MPALLRSLLLVSLTMAAVSAVAQETPEEAGAEAQVVEAPVEAPVEAEAASESWMTQADAWFGGSIVGPMANFFFYDLRQLGGEVEGVELGQDATALEKARSGNNKLPAVVVWLALGAIFLTLRMGFINLRAFVHAIRVTKGDYDDEDDDGEVTHFQALSSALSATVGLGNIGSVAVAVGLGGPGAIFWMVMCGLFGMSSKFTECTLGQMYRRVDPDGHVSGGPMRYLSEGLRDLRLGPVGLLLASVFAVLCIGASFGGGCAFQVSQSRLAVNEALIDGFGLTPDVLDSKRWVYGLVLAGAVGVVIIGGIKRIAATAEKIVPFMCIVYVVTALVILGLNYDKIGDAIGQILGLAWAKESLFGGVIGAAMLGIQRAAFSNEAGIGSAAIAHSAAKTKYPVREGIVALLEPFIDTVMICTITGLVIVVTGVCDDPANATAVAGKEGATLTSLAFSSAVPWFKYVLAVAVLLFAYSTMISWSYYGERCATYLFGSAASLPYRLLFLGAVFFGAVIDASNILDFSDLMILAMSVPNLIGLYLLSGKVKLKLDDYWQAYKLGDFEMDREG